jgi:hypothetical protein
MKTQRVISQYILIFTLFIGTNCNSQKSKPDIIYKEPKMVDVRMIIDDQTIDQGDVFKIIEPLWWSVDIYQSEKIYNEGLKRFTESQKFVFAIEWYLAEVNNGGHAQFFSNSTGIVWKDALQGFQKLGLDENYQILKAAADSIGGNPSLDRGEREKQLNKYDEGFETLDMQFYETDKVVSIETKLLIFIKENKKDFYFSGQVRKPKDF